jgi:hypothetical protein
MTSLGRAPVVASDRGLSPLRDARPFPVLVSNSHTVAAQRDCTNIPLAAGRAQEGETNLYLGCLGHVGVRVAHLDLLGLIRSQ